MPLHAYDLGSLASDHPAMPDFFISVFVAATGILPGHSGSFSIKTRRSVAGSPRSAPWSITVPAGHQLHAVQAVTKYLPEKILTELAGVTMAAVPLARVLGIRIKEVAMSGERGDYWLETTSGAPAGLIEVSGTLSKSLKTRYQHKRSQVLKNSTAGDCYVSVTHFVKREGYFCRVR